MELQNRRKLVPERLGMVKWQEARRSENARALFDRTNEEANGEVPRRARVLPTRQGYSAQNGDDEGLDSHKALSVV